MRSLALPAAEGLHPKMRCLLFVTLVGHAAGAESGSGSAYNLSSTAWRVLNLGAKARLMMQDGSMARL
jgi:hypothetical protein